MLDVGMLKTTYITNDITINFIQQNINVKLCIVSTFIYIYIYLFIYIFVAAIMHLLTMYT